MISCPFCQRLRDGPLIATSALAAAFADAYPVSPGHTLVVPRRHEPDLHSLEPQELGELWDLSLRVREILERERPADGYNIGVNIGEAAGQTVPHAHLHVIPRFAGDSSDPRGGIRWVLPESAPYWEDDGRS